MLKKKSRKQLVKSLDKSFSEYIRARDKNTCVTCRSTRNSTCGHLFSRTSYSTRWNTKNAFCQCWGCNYRHEFDSYPLTMHFISVYGKVAYDDLHAEYVIPVKYKDYQLEEMIEYYRNQKKALDKHDK